MTVEGNAAGSVRVIAYVDLQCPDCAAYSAMLDEQLVPRYGTEVAFEDRDFPLPKHSWARPAAIAAVAFTAVRPELGLAFRKLCFRRQREISADSLQSIIEEFAHLHGAEMPQDVGRFAAQVRADYDEGVARGVVRTPTVFVADAAFVETFTPHELADAIERALISSRTLQ